jgi:hypothetical protein
VEHHRVGETFRRQIHGRVPSAELAYGSDSALGPVILASLAATRALPTRMLPSRVVSASGTP